MNSVLANQFIHFPQSAFEVGEAIANFKSDLNYKIPQVLGVVDGTHIEIVSPDCPSKIDYYAHTKRYTINTQLLVGANLFIFDVATGFPGSCHDGRVWRHTNTCKALEAKTVAQYPEEIIERVRIKPILLADAAYPLGPQVIKPYPYRNGLTREERKFNRLLSSTRVTVERAIGIKARFRILLKRLDSDIINVSDVIIACVVLHNFCLLNNDTYSDNDGVLDLLISNERETRNLRMRSRTRNADGINVREILKRYVNL